MTGRRTKRSGSRSKRTSEDIVRQLRGLANPKNAEGMARFGINPRNTLGVSVTTLRKMAKGMGRDHELAQELWSTDIHESRMLACLIDDPDVVTERQMDRWVKDFDSWDICDICCNSLFGETRFAWKKALEWSGKNEEFVKRAGFVMMAVLAVHDKEADDKRFVNLLPIIARASDDERNFVRKAVNWSLRQIGKRNLVLNEKAIRAAESIRSRGSRSSRWIATDALRELTSDAARERLSAKARKKV